MLPVPELKTPAHRLYETDYDLWVREIVEQLRNRDFDALDLENLIEEVADLSRRDRQNLKNLLRRLFEYFLKIKYWESEIQRNKHHWLSEILSFRMEILDELEDSPSLKIYLQQIFDGCYQDARKLVSVLATIPLSAFPDEPIANLEQILDENWLP